MARIPVKMCLSKEKYESKKEALCVIEYLRRRALEENYSFSNNLKIYKCPLCHKYHLGSKNNGR